MTGNKRKMQLAWLLCLQWSLEQVRQARIYVTLRAALVVELAGASSQTTNKTSRNILLDRVQI